MNTTLRGNINLDLDKSKMEEAIQSFPFQISDAIAKFQNINLINKYQEINNIMILGVGGSAIGADLAKIIVNEDCCQPIILNRSYTIPNWVNSKTLIIACSYSGNTEETLNAFKQCKKRNCKIIIISTGGKLVEEGQKLKLDNIIIPSGYQPRAALGYSFMFIILLLEKLRYIPNIIIKNINNSIKALKILSFDLSKEKNSAIEIAQIIHSTCPVIYGSENLTGVVALRFRCQLAENAKMLSFHNNFPEQNHNEIEGWTVNKNIINKFSLIWLRDSDDYFKIKTRMDISSKLLNSIPKYQLTISQSGNNKIERLLKLIHYTDWISFYAAIFNNVDPTPVKRIESLKIKINKTR